MGDEGERHGWHRELIIGIAVAVAGLALSAGSISGLWGSNTGGLRYAVAPSDAVGVQPDAVEVQPDAVGVQPEAWEPPAAPPPIHEELLFIDGEHEIAMQPGHFYSVSCANEVEVTTTKGAWRLESRQLGVFRAEPGAETLTIDGVGECTASSMSTRLDRQP